VLSKVASGKASVSPEMAVRLEAGLGIAARLWLSMHAGAHECAPYEKCANAL
jgi:plasmid maintenance system antidote protein VapI